jgi:hypothetical protein
VFGLFNILIISFTVPVIFIANILHAIVMVVYAKSLLHLIVDAIPIGLMGVLPLLFYPWDFSKFIRY